MRLSRLVSTVADLPEPSPMSMAGRRVLVTGGAHRIGRHICLDLARAGARVTFSWLSAERQARAALAELQAIDAGASAVRCDVTRLRDVHSLRDHLYRRGDGLDLCINSASPWEFDAFPLADYASWHRVTRASIDGCVYVCNELLPLLLESSSPSIINILDTIVRQPRTGLTAHAVGKAGLEALTRQLALELAPRVRVNGLVPGPVLPQPDLSPKARRRVADATLLGRWGTPEDVVRGVRFLIDSDFVTGSLLFIDGGESIAMHRRPR